MPSLEHVKVVEINGEQVTVDGVVVPEDEATEYRERFLFDQQIYRALRCQPEEKRVLPENQA